MSITLVFCLRSMPVPGGLKIELSARGGNTKQSRIHTRGYYPMIKTLIIALVMAVLPLCGLYGSGPGYEVIETTNPAFYDNTRCSGNAQGRSQGWQVQLRPFRGRPECRAQRDGVRYQVCAVRTRWYRARTHRFPRFKRGLEQLSVQMGDGGRGMGLPFRERWSTALSS